MSFGEPNLIKIKNSEAHAGLFLHLTVLNKKKKLVKVLMKKNIFLLCCKDSHFNLSCIINWLVFVGFAVEIMPSGCIFVVLYFLMMLLIIVHYPPGASGNMRVGYGTGGFVFD
ncbi:MAG: hypothetical protein LBH04_02805 [Tannerellaceae bacterium]|jgi:hypothetical protein|nr:hypothetical protein [Tannerellaceae bacterium]